MAKSGQTEPPDQENEMVGVGNSKKKHRWYKGVCEEKWCLWKKGKYGTLEQDASRDKKINRKEWRLAN